MKLFLIERDTFEYDEHDAVLIRAETEHQAREIAARTCYPHGDTWRTSPCVVVEVDGEIGEVLSSFRAG